MAICHSEKHWIDEALLLQPIIDLATLKVDTSHLNLYQLRDHLKQRLLGTKGSQPSVLIQSFGFKRGLPVDADLVFDVRCLPNPYWLPDLRAFSGRDTPVSDYLSKQPEVEEMYQDICQYLKKWLPRYAASERSYMTIAIGCTGGASPLGLHRRALGAGTEAPAPQTC